MKYAIGSIIVFVSIFVFGLLLFFHDARRPPSAILNDAAATASSSAAIDTERRPPAGWREYANTHYKFSLFFPSAMKMTEFDEGEGASTITFEDDKTVQAFQIFIVPYADSQMSEARFKRDEPSGVKNNLTDITVDGATGAAFYSADAALGDTREIWFIKNGFLYEATTLKSESSLLESIMQEWKFI